MRLPVRPPDVGDNADHVPWYAYLVRLSGASASWRDRVRVPSSIVGPLAAGLALQSWTHDAKGLAIGVMASIGALVGAVAPQRGPAREKLARTAAGVALGAAGLAVGRFAAAGGWQAVVLVAALAALAALLSAVSANISFGALQFLVYIAVGSGLKSGLPEPDVAVSFVAGGLWAMLLTFVATLTDRVDPDRAVVRDVFSAIGTLLRRSGNGEHPSIRQGVTDALNRAYDQVARSRSIAPGRSPRLAWLAGVLNGIQPLVDGAIALYRSDEAATPEDLAAVAELGDAVLTDRPPVAGPPPPTQSASAASRQVREGVCSVWSVVAGRQEFGPAKSRDQNWRRSLSDLASRTVASPDSREFALRLALCMAVAEIVREHLPYERPYWVLLTVAIVLKPDFGSVFVRGVQRIVGTVLGVVVGAAALALVPHDAWMLIPMVIAASVMPWAQAANYGLFVLSLTPVVVILLDIAAPADAGVVTARLVDTVLGAVIVLVFGYLLWPQTWRTSFDAPFQRVVLALDAFVGAAFGPVGPHANVPCDAGRTNRHDDRRQARRHTFRALTELQTTLQRQLAQPPPLSNRARGWWPLVVQMERTADAVIGSAVAIDNGASPPDAKHVASLRRTIRELARPVNEPCAEVPVASSTDVLAPVDQEVARACRLRRGIGAGRRRRDA